MDIKTLLYNLHEEVSCSVCMCMFTTPKQLPCLHSFCLNCLNGIQRTSGIHGKITCPECRKQFDIPGSGNPSGFPTNFRINRLLDVLAIKECNTAGVKCGNCDKRRAETLYCFQCCSFWCAECISAHNIIRANKQHKTLALKDFQDQDIEAVLKRPAFCQTKNHENKELEFFCKVCQVAICNACAVTEHEGHAKTEGIGNVKTAFNGTKAQQAQAKCFRPVLSFGEEGKSVGKLQTPWGVAVNDRDEIAVTDNSRVSVFSSDGTHLRSFGKAGSNNGEFNWLRGVTFDKHGNIIVADSGNHRIQVLSRKGKFLSKFGEKGSQDHQLRGPEGVSLTSDGDIIVVDRFINEILIKIFSPNGECIFEFGSKGSLLDPWHCIQQGEYYIVSDLGDHCIKMFDLKGNFIFKFGMKGNKDGEFNNPTFLSVNKEGLLMVCDNGNHRVQVFDLSGNFVTKFGSRGSRAGEFKFPIATASLGDGRVVVSDSRNNRIQVFDQM
ncbi:unnamed protein product [Porites lobata]|uniref:E3 ubiquitin-protein ligase TRIM71 n=1 Tax=Porites lobata TaxID=104759 RepID=A0ABN8REZ9_9CNID|nr:unnamed protein product [Porites lobata]